MAKPVPVEMRRAALDAYERGEGTLADIARIFGVSVQSLVRWRALEQCGEDLAPLPHSGGRSTQKIFEEHRRALRDWLTEQPDLFNRELAGRLLDEFGIQIDPSQLSRILAEMELPPKKRHT